MSTQRVICILAVLGLAAALSSPAWAEIIEEPVAFVNGEILTRSELLDREAQVVSQLQRQFSGTELDDKVEEVKKRLLTDMVRELLLLQRAEILGLDLDQVYKSALDNLKAQQGIKTNDEMKQLLRQEGISEEELRRILLRFNVPDIMINLEVRQKIVAPDEEVKDYFEAHKEEFRIEETFTIQEVVVLFEGHERPELEEIAARVQADMEAGLPFGELVLKYSEAPSRFQEGKVGPLRAPDISLQLRDVLTGLAEGDVAGPIWTDHGVHFVRMEARTEAKEPGLEDVRGGIENRIRQEKFAGELEAYWERLYRENRIQVKPLYRGYALGLPRS
jgi:parvulin-like peptidyl-prolyl isomerase